MAKFKKGDLVQVLAGKDRGKRGKILQVLPARHAALVERINLVKHFERRSQANQAGGVIEREAPMGLAKLGVVCGQCGRPTRVGFRLTPAAASQPTGSAPTGQSDGIKERICKRCGGLLRG